MQFIAKRTGLSVDLVDRVVEGGEPWPHVATFGKFAESLGQPLGTILTGENNLLDDGLDALELDENAVKRHQQYVATSLGVNEDVVGSISEAMQEFFRMRFEELRQAKRERSRD